MVNAQIAEVKPKKTEIEELEYKESLKFNRWAKLFTDKSDPQLYGNATRCAIKVYGAKKYHTAGAIGSQNYKKLRSIKEYIVDNEGYGIADLMKIGLAKVIKGDYSDWENFMIQMGYMNPQPKVGVAIQNNFNMAELGAAVAQARKDRGLQ